MRLLSFLKKAGSAVRYGRTRIASSRTVSSVRKEIDFGALRRTTPFSGNYGLYRGGSIDRYYIDPFVKASVANTRGRYLEFGHPTYRKFAAPENIESYDIVDVDPANGGATIHGDVAEVSTLAGRRFDVIICTQVLQYVPDPGAALRHMRLALTPGGLLVLSTPFISKADSDRDRWRFTQHAVEELLADFAHVDVLARGNLFASVCYWMGMGLNDVTTADLEGVDPQHYCVVLATARK